MPTTAKELTLEQDAALGAMRDREDKRYPYLDRMVHSTDVEVARLEGLGLIETVPGGYVLTKDGRTAVRTGVLPE